MKNIAVHLAEGFEEIEAIAIIDVLRRAGLKVTVVSVTGSLQITGSHQIGVMADELFENVEYSSFDMIVLPGGMPGAENLNQHQGLKKQIESFNTQGKLLGAICAAPLVFGQMGILEGKKATCFPGFEKFLKGAQISGEATEVAGNIVTGKGAGVAVHFALKIVEMIKGPAVANDLSKRMIVS